MGIKFKYRILGIVVFVAVIVLLIDYEIITRTKIALADNPIALESKSIKQGQAVYVQYCQSCHGNTGHGDGTLNRTLNKPPANLTTLDQPAGITAMKIYFGNEPMPAWRNSLSMTQIWHLTNFIESIQTSIIEE